jgi:hypothetical protein
MATLNSRQCATLCEIFKKPTSANIKYLDIVKVLQSLGLSVKQTKSGVLANIAGMVWSTHRAHPTPYVGKAAINDLRNYLAAANLTPATLGCVCKP